MYEESYTLKFLMVLYKFVFILITIVWFLNIFYYKKIERKNRDFY